MCFYKFYRENVILSASFCTKDPPVSIEIIITLEILRAKRRTQDDAGELQKIYCITNSLEVKLSCGFEMFFAMCQYKYCTLLLGGLNCSLT